MNDLLSAVLAWRTLVIALMLFGIAPGVALRLIVRLYRKDDPRRREMLAELYAVRRWERPFWVCEQLELAVFSGLVGRLSSWLRLKHQYLSWLAIAMAGSGLVALVAVLSISVAAAIGAVVVAVLLTLWCVRTLVHLDRLHARVDAAQAALDAQLVRRATALQYAAGLSDSGVPVEVRAEWNDIARQALSTRASDRQRAEQRVSEAIAELAGLPSGTGLENLMALREAMMRVQVARRFYNDAVRDTRTLRAHRMPRMFRMAGRRELPQYFDIDDRIE